MSTQAQALFEAWKKKIEADARELGRQEGLELARQEGVALGRQQMLLKVYEARFGAVPASIRTAIEATHDAAAFDHWTVLLVTLAKDEIATAMLERPQ